MHRTAGWREVLTVIRPLAHQCCFCGNGNNRKEKGRTVRHRPRATKKVIPWRGASSHLELKRWYNSPLFISSQYQVFTCDLSTQGPLGSSPSWCIFGFLTMLMCLWVTCHADASLGYSPCWLTRHDDASLDYPPCWRVFGLLAMLTCSL